MPRPKRSGRKGLQKVDGRKSTKFETDLRALRKAGKLVAGMSPDARRWLKSKLA